MYHDFEDYVEAKAYYEKALSLDPQNLTALVDLGNVCFKLFDYDGAFKYYSQVFSLEPDNQTVALCLANTLSLKKDEARANQYFEKALKLTGDSLYRAYICYAISKSDFGHYDEAIELYKKAIKLEPDQSKAHILLGNMYSNQRKFAEAEAEYKEALKISQLDPDLYILIANTYYMNNEIERSIYSYKAAVGLSPENDEFKLVYIQVIEDYIEESRKDEVVAEF